MKLATLFLFLLFTIRAVPIEQHIDVIIRKDCMKDEAIRLEDCTFDANFKPQCKGKTIINYRKGCEEIQIVTSR